MIDTLTKSPRSQRTRYKIIFGILLKILSARLYLNVFEKVLTEWSYFSYSVSVSIIKSLAFPMLTTDEGKGRSEYRISSSQVLDARTTQNAADESAQWHNWSDPWFLYET